MTKYFSIPVITSAIENLKLVDGKWLLIPFVLAANGVNSAEPVDCSHRQGTGKYLKRFLDGTLIGLEPKEPGGPCNIRPLFTDLKKGASDNRLLHIDYSELWGRTFSQSGYPAMRDGDTLLKTTGSIFQLGPNFQTNFRARIDNGFKFESLLVWIYAFSGIDDGIGSWQELLNHFNQNFTHSGSGFPSEYASVFSLTNSEPWPQDFLKTRPSIYEFQDAFLPGMRACHIEPEGYGQLRLTLTTKLREAFLAYGDSEIEALATSAISGLQSCRRLFLFGEPGTGKTEFARLIVTAFEETFDDRVHSVFAAIADSTTADKLFGFSTLDGRWVDGILTQKDSEMGRQLLYEMQLEAEGGKNRPILAQTAQRQINLLVLDEANRRDIEEMLVKIQASLDAESASPEHVAFKISLDNAGDRYISPHTFLVMTGNSPRDDMGRVVQSRPFKRRHNLIIVPNVFDRLLDHDDAAFANDLKQLWEKVGPVLSLTDAQRADFGTALIANSQLVGSLRLIFKTLKPHSVGVSYGLVKKLLKTSGARYSHITDFRISIDYGLTESIFPLLSAEAVVGGNSVRDSLLSLDEQCKSRFPVFFKSVSETLTSPDSFGRVRPFI